MTRAERMLEARRLKAEGLNASVIGARLSVPASTIRNWTNGGSCVDCGTPLDGSGIRGREERCHRCACIVMGAERKVWTREACVAAIQEWAEKYGEPPGAADWDPWQARHVLHDEARAQRFEEAGGCRPWTTSVVEAFGSWNAAIRAAGFEPRAPHGGDGNHLRHRAFVPEREAA